MTRGRVLLAAVLLVALPAAFALGEGSRLAQGVRALLDGPWPLALAVYAAAHGVRVVRLAALAGGAARSVRDLASAHLATVAAGALLPLKLGEGVRVLAVGESVGGPAAGLRVVWVERTFDAAVLALASAGTAWFVPEARAAVAPVGAAAVGVLLLTALALLVLPENVAMAKAFVIRRYTTDASLTTLGVLGRVGTEVRAAREHVRGKLATLGVLTLVIWALEGGALALVGRDDPSGDALTATLASLSRALLPQLGGPLDAHRALVVATSFGLATVGLVARGVRAPGGAR